MKLRTDSPSRPRASEQLLADLARRLTPRDRYLCHMLNDHRVLTTEQICDLAFDSLNAAQHRLLTLYRHRVLERFRPFTITGSAPFHYVLDQMGAAILAAERDTELHYRRDKALAIAHSQRLDHTVGVNGFFTSLTAAARRSAGHSELVRWWSERRCADTWGHIVQPDGYGRWRDQDREIDFFLEYDRGTEPLYRLTDKLDHYAELATTTGINTPVAFSLPTAAREASARRALQGTTVPVATSHRTTRIGPSAGVWLSVDAMPDQPTRHTLTDVGSRTLR